MTARRTLGERLPGFPWDSLAAAGEIARAHADGVIDLSVGTPVDPVPRLIQDALATAADWPGYPTTHGTPALRETLAAWAHRVLGARLDPAREILPTIGSKELVGALPTLLGLGAGDTVVIPRTAYPTYAIGAQSAGADVVAADATTALGPAPVALVWINSPSNPTGKVLPVEHLAKVVAWARERGAVVASDECYFELGWDAAPVSVLHPDVCGGSYDGLLAVHSASKRSNLAGYRAAMVLGDARLVGSLLAARKHLGMIVPGPVQAAMAAAYADDTHVAEQRERYRTRRAALLAAVRSAGFTVEHSEAGLYLWTTRDEPCVATVDWFARRGILVAPGDFYGAAGARHVRIALTATDERIAAAVARLR